ETGLKLARVNDGIDSTLMILQHRLKANAQRPAIQILKDYGEIPEIACYPGQLNQVFMNILANAIDALDDSQDGLAYKDLEAHPHTIQIRTQVSDAQRLTVSIQDNGPGIPEAVRSKLFNPFFTTKPVGKGTGLGLSISYRIITEKHGGKLFCDSVLGQGTTFVIELPIRQQVLDGDDPGVMVLRN
ncbi:MAG: HAMP domain-containing sensor histidine kinase, partial [Cyanobacteria bacterium]|nr:HAMP domain-containing sensor histidine kinase [Cyanobacteriota bacterium]